MSSARRLGLFEAVLAAAILMVPAAAQAQAKFKGIGDLPEGSFHSEVRDATKVGSTIVAVGNGNKQTSTCPSPCGTGDVGLLWIWDGSGTSAGVLTALPEIVANTAATTFVTASAVTPDGLYVAARARSSASNGQRQAVRVTTALLPSPEANINLAAFPPALAANTAATALSADGSILYGFDSAGRAVRFDVAGPSSMLIPSLAGATATSPAARATSSDGSVLVGWANIFRSNSRAFLYVHPDDESGEIAPLTGGTWNAALAVSPNGGLVLVAGNSASYPDGEVYIYDATDSSTTPLGSPNRSWWPRNVAGMTDDGAVVAIDFGGPSRNFAYFRNGHGWFMVASALAAQGIDVKSQGWTELNLAGMSSDGTLLFGSGVHNGEYEGWVAEFDSGFLAGFNPQAAPPSGTAIVGAWNAPDSESGSPSVLVFMADGTYFQMQAAVTDAEMNAAPGIERGLFTWAAGTGAFTVTTLADTNGDAGLSDNNGMLDAKLFVSGDSISRTPGGAAIATRITVPANAALNETLTGGWVIKDPDTGTPVVVVVFEEGGTYYFAQDGPSDGAGRPGIEQGTFTWDPSTGELTPTAISVDTNGEWGLSNSTGASFIQPSIDGLDAQAGDTTGPMPAARVIDPESVVPSITSPANAAGTASVPFSYTVTATNGAYEFGATALPAGLSIDEQTGVISGATLASGPITVTVSASNSLRTGSATVTFTFAPPNTSAGVNVPVQPDVPDGQPAVSLSFSAVTSAGETSVTTVDSAVAPAPPSGFQLGPVYYNISTTAQFTGPVTLCFSYAGASLGGGTPRLFHFTGSWVDITTSVDEAAQVICGTAESFSPFAVFVSPIVRTGFYAPVSSSAGFVNTVKGGATVPLKFNVTVDGVEMTDPNQVAFSVKPVNCDPAAEDPVDFVTTGSTSLRYDSTEGHFIQNWKTPKAAGLCYIVRVTTTADGLSLSALFKTK